MPGLEHSIDKKFDAEKFIQRFDQTLVKIVPELSDSIEFSHKVQRENLEELVEDTSNRIEKYENIYPYIKDICQNQNINPTWYSGIEKVLSWALNKGRGKTKILTKEIKNAWLTYIVLLSCSMIDRENLPGKGSLFNSPMDKFMRIRGNN